MPPKIGVTSGFRIKRSPRGAQTPQIILDIRFCDMVRRAGGRAVIVPPIEEPDALERELKELDGIVLSGGDDVPPERYGAQRHPAAELLQPRRVVSDFRLMELVDARELPVLAVCAGIQEWNVHRGGTLHQHLPDCGFNPAVVHRDPGRKEFLVHPVRFEPGSLIASILGTECLEVNTWHHQGIAELGRDLVATAWSEDGLIEAAEDPRRRFCLGLQWHPEDMAGDPLQQRLFDALVEAAK